MHIHTCVSYIYIYTYTIYISSRVEFLRLHEQQLAVIVEHIWRVGELGLYIYIAVYTDWSYVYIDT